MSTRLSIIVPAFNEEKTLSSLLENLLSLDLGKDVEREIILVDDASSDETPEIGIEFERRGILYFRHSINSGKGAAVRTGIEKSSGDFILIQDADLEYCPGEIPHLLNTIIEKTCSSVYGSRVKGARKLNGIRRLLRLWPAQPMSSYLFNFLLSFWLFCLQKVWLTDTLTGYKIYSANVFSGWTPQTSGFETDHEITSRILNTGGSIFEIPISYSPRNKKEGKKIRAIDGWLALKTFWGYRK
jgi:glycosyltransferase involved in cell wall biosynthesis